MFTVASFACGIAPNATFLIAFRAVQGLGAALLMPQTMSLVIATFPAERRGTALGIWGAVAGLATVAGPTLGGLLVTGLSWRWIFFVNIPVGAAVLALTFWVIPDTRMQRQHRLDLPGVGLATAALFCLTFALIEGQRYSWGPGIWALFVAAAVLFVAFLIQQRGRQEQEPLVPFVLFRDRNFAVINVVAALVSVGILGFYLPLTIYLQSVLGFSALKAGLVLAPSSLVGMCLAPDRRADVGPVRRQVHPDERPDPVRDRRHADRRPGPRRHRLDQPCCPARWCWGWVSAASSRRWRRRPCAASTRGWPERRPV